MLFNPKHDTPLARLEERIRLAEDITPELMLDVIAFACCRFHALGVAPKREIRRLIQAGALTDATLALLELELPQWQLRRLVKDDGEWLCTLSKQPGLPLGYDEVAEGCHEILPLAMLIAFLSARRAVAVTAAGESTVPLVRAEPGHAVCCDNFS